nr:hypothetical protein [Tanacetum cinerariifolium]
MRVASVNGKKYILVIVDDYSSLRHLSDESEQIMELSLLIKLCVNTMRSLEPALHEITPVIISSGLVSNPSLSTPFVPPSRTNWDLLFQPLFDKLHNPPPSVDLPAPEVIASIAEVEAP